jgi:16S rRNA processing protein RimM
MVVMGHIGAPFGVKGWVKVHPYTGSQDALLDYPAWWLGRGETEDWRQMPVAEATCHGKVLIARLGGCMDRDAAARLYGLRVGVPRSELPPAGTGEIYWTDLEGLSAVNLQGEELGVVDGLLETGASPVLVVKGDRERLIPFVAPVVRQVDRKAGRILVDWGADY